MSKKRETVYLYNTVSTNIFLYFFQLWFSYFPFTNVFLSSRALQTLQPLIPNLSLSFELNFFSSPYLFDYSPSNSNSNSNQTAIDSSAMVKRAGGVVVVANLSLGRCPAGLQLV
jgi:hypothetical protein